MVTIRSHGSLDFTGFALNHSCVQNEERPISGLFRQCVCHKHENPGCCRRAKNGYITGLVGIKGVTE